MSAYSPYPARFTLLAALTGAIAWGLPVLISPFIPHIPFMPHFPRYEAPPYQINLAELTISFFLSGILAGGIFLLGLRFLPINPQRYSRPVLSTSLVLSLLAGMGIGGALAIFFGLIIAYSQPGFRLASLLDLYGILPDPVFSICLVISTALTTIIVCSFSGLRKQLPLPMLNIALQVAGRALLVRLVVYLVEYSSIVRFTSGRAILIFILFQAAAGVLFGILVWKYVTGLKPASASQAGRF